MRVTLFKILLYLVVFTIPATTLGNMITRRHFDGFGDNYLPYGGIGVPMPPIQSLHVMGKWMIKNDSIIFLTDNDPAGPYRCLSNFTYTDTIHPAKIINRNCIKLFNLHENLDSTFNFPDAVLLGRANGKFLHD